jgi:CxxC motif-containing protein (DUF1111 family)
MSPHRRAGAAVLALVGAIAACDDAPTTTAPAPSDLPPAEALLIPFAPAGSPLPGLSPAQRALFRQGSAVFQIEFVPENGLGPLFNAVGCAACHENPVVGGSGSNDPEEEGEDVETHASAFIGAVCDDRAAVGGQVVQQQVTPALEAALGITAEPDIPGATASGRRTTPDVFGFGLLDAVPDAEIAALADPYDLNGDGISGRVHRLPDGRVGRFGRKAQEADLTAFNSGAFVMEMGVTNPGNQTEQTVGGNPLPDGVDPTPEPEITQDEFAAADAFVHLLAPPRPRPLDFTGVIGKAVFGKIGCASCHVPALVTGASPVSAISRKVVPAYTDLLLHDMGPRLADICLGEALPSEFRTEPLMGLRFATAFMHDGRALTIQQAIAAHGGEAAGARSRFARLTLFERFALLKFLRTL